MPDTLRVPVAFSTPPVQPIWIVDAALQPGPVTDRPEHSLEQMCVRAAAELFERHPALREQVERVYFGTMGIQPAAAVETARGHLANVVRESLDLTGVKSHASTSVTATSQSGAEVLSQAWEDMQRPDGPETVLVISGEAMFSRGADREGRRADRASIQRQIQGVIAEQERLPGLGMIHVGDLLMDGLVWESGLDAARWAAVLELATLSKYQRGLRFDRGMQPAKELVGAGEVGDRLVTRGDYRDPSENRRVTPWFRKHDVGAPASGATALLLTRRRSAGMRVAICGVGESHTRTRIAARSGQPTRPNAIRRALCQLCDQVGLDPARVVASEGAFALFHDAFPSIELLFLRELHTAASAGAVDPESLWLPMLRDYLRGRSNPLGGLSASGHALGNSGLLQAAQAFHLIAEAGGQPSTLLSSSLPDDLTLAPPAPRMLLLTSVGAALTDVVTTLIADLGHGPVAGPELPGDPPADLAKVDATFGEEIPPDVSFARSPYLAGVFQHPGWGALGRAVTEGAADADEGIVCAATEIPDGRWVHLVLCPYDESQETSYVLAAAADHVPNGAWVRWDRAATPTPILTALARPPLAGGPAWPPASLAALDALLEEVDQQLGPRRLSD